MQLDLYKQTLSLMIKFVDKCVNDFNDNDFNLLATHTHTPI